MVDEAGQFAEVGMSAELYGMFFVAEDVFGGENSGRRRPRRSEEHTSELQSHLKLVCRLLLEKKNRASTEKR